MLSAPWPRRSSPNCKASPPTAFAKVHAASFALIAYQTLWLKAHYPAEFYCALLNHQPMGFYSPEVVIGDAKRHGITVLRPDANVSQDECALEQGRSTSSPWPLNSAAPQLRLGLRYLAGLGAAGGRACWPRGGSGRSSISPISAAGPGCRGRWWVT